MPLQGLCACSLLGKRAVPRLFNEPFHLLRHAPPVIHGQLPQLLPPLNRDSYHCVLSAHLSLQRWLPLLLSLV